MFQERGFFIKERNKIVFPPLTYIHPIIIEQSDLTTILNNNNNSSSISIANNIFKTFFQEKFYTDSNMNIYNAQELINKHNIKYEVKNDIHLILNKKQLLPSSTNKDNLYYNYSIDSFLEESLPIYIIFIDVCLENNITAVIDIGCASGIQSLFFNMNDINYLGVESDINNPFFPFVLCNRLRYRNVNDDGQCLLEASFHNSLIYTNYMIASFPLVKIDDTIDKFNHMDISSLISSSNISLVSSWCLFHVVHDNLETQINSLISFKSSILNISNETIDYLLNNKKFISYMNLEVVATYDDASIVYIKRKDKK